MNILRASFHASLVAAVALLAGCQQAAVQPNSPAALEDIRLLNNQFLKAFNAKDAAGVAAVYAEDAMLMPPNTPAVTTRPAIQFFTSTQFTPDVTGMLLNASENVVMGDYAYSMGYYTILGANNSTLDHGKFVEILKHGPDGWRIYRDIYNSDNPPTQPGAMPAPSAATH